MENYVRFHAAGEGSGGGDDGPVLPEERVLPIVWRVLLGYPEARKEVARVLEELVGEKGEGRRLFGLQSR